MSDAYPMDLITRLRDEAGLCRIETATDIAVLLEEAADDLERQEQSLTASEKRAAQAVDALLDISAMGKKAGSELAKHRLMEMGIDWQTGDPTPNYGSMT